MKRCTRNGREEELAALVTAPSLPPPFALRSEKVLAARKCVAVRLRLRLKEIGEKEGIVYEFVNEFLYVEGSL